MQTRKWTDTAGAERYTTEVVLQGFGATLTMLDSKNSADTSSSSNFSEESSSNNFKQPSFAENELEDEIPF